MLPVNTTIFLAFSIVLEVIRWLVLPIHLYAFIAPLLRFCHGLITVVFLLQHHPTLLWQHSHIHPQRSENALWIVWDSHPLFPPSGFVTATATLVLSIFTCCAGYVLSISVGNKCVILHSLFLHYFNVNMLHVQSCPFSPSKPFTLGSR